MARDFERDTNGLPYVRNQQEAVKVASEVGLKAADCTAIMILDDSHKGRPTVCVYHKDTDDLMFMVISERSVIHEIVDVLEIFGIPNEEIEFACY